RRGSPWRPPPLLLPFRRSDRRQRVRNSHGAPALLLLLPVVQSPLAVDRRGPRALVVLGQFRFDGFFLFFVCHREDSSEGRISSLRSQVSESQVSGLKS